MGNDEHSQNVFASARRSRARIRSPTATRWSRCSATSGRALDISFDDFIRTTDRRGTTPACRSWSQACLDNGDIYEGVYEGWYCVGCEAFKQEKDLVDGLCPIHQTKPEWIKEKNWFFRLSKYQQPLLDALRGASRVHRSPRCGATRSCGWSKAGLEDISISRAGQSWGIPLPFDPTSVVYVWFDALINYAAAVGYGWDDERFEKWWPANLHVIGKDITRFHCVIWPAMLMSAGLPLPRQVFGHGWVYVKGERMSKSLGNIVDPLDAAERLRAGSAAAVPGQGNRRSAATATSPGSASRRSTTPTSRTTSATSSAAWRRWPSAIGRAGCRADRAADRWPASRPRRVAAYRARDGRASRCTRARRRRSGWSSAANEFIAETRRGRWPRIRRRRTG